MHYPNANCRLEEITPPPAFRESVRASLPLTIELNPTQFVVTLAFEVIL
jgi:hypothetical protein